MQLEPSTAVSEPQFVAASDARQRSWLSAAYGLCVRHVSLVAAVGTSIGVVGMNAVQGMILARLLGPEGRGAYSAATFYTQTFLFIGLLGGLFVVARRAARDEAELSLLRSAALRYGTLTGVVTTAFVCLLAAVALPTEKSYLLPLCCAGALLLPGDHVRRLLLAIDQGSANFWRYNIGQIFHALALPLLLVVAWLAWGVTLEIAVVLTVFSPCVGLLAWKTMSPRPTLTWSPAYPPVATLVREGRGYWLAVLADDLFGRLDLLLVLWLASLPVQGYYAAAVPAAGLVCSATTALALFSFNAGARARGPVSTAQLAKLAAVVLAFQTVVSLALAAVVEPLILIVYGQQFQAAASFALALLPANALYGCSQVAEGYLRGRNRNRTSVWSRVLGAVLMIAATLAFWPAYQVMSIPLAFAVGQATVLACLSAAVMVDARHGDGP